MNAALAFLNGAGHGRQRLPDSIHDDHVSMMHLLLAAHPLPLPRSHARPVRKSGSAVRGSPRRLRTPDAATPR